MINDSSKFNLELIFSNIANLNNSVAIKYINDRNYSFEELEKFSNKIANFLLSNGFKKGDIIAIFNDKDLLSFSFMIASLKIGCIYSNLDRNVPESRLLSILNQIKPKLLLGEDFNLNNAIRNSLSEDLLVINNKKLQQTLGNYSPNLPKEVFKIGSSNIAYIMFTSGSTGTPKGVTISHANLINFINWSKRRI